jgi:quinol monooxygenase YgiN
VVQLLVEFAVRPDRVPDVLDAMHTLMRPARLDRACSAVALWRGVDDAQVIHFAEEWGSQDDLDRELCTERLGRLLDLLEVGRRAAHHRGQDHRARRRPRLHRPRSQWHRVGRRELTDASAA